MADYLSNTEEFTSVAEAIRTKGGTTAQLAWPAGFVQAVDAIQTGGGDYEFLSKATHIEFANINSFGAENVVLNLPNVHWMDNMICPNGYYSPNTENKTVKHITINSSEKPVTFYHIVSPQGGSGGYIDQLLNRITLNVDTSQATNFKQAFWGNNNLKTIDGFPLDFSSVTNAVGAFAGCYGLEEIRFSENTIHVDISIDNCGRLSSESVQSIIDGLATISESKSIHLNHALSISDSQKAQITSKNWTLVQ